MAEIILRSDPGEAALVTPDGDVAARWDITESGYRVNADLFGGGGGSSGGGGVNGEPPTIEALYVGEIGEVYGASAIPFKGNFLSEEAAKAGGVVYDNNGAVSGFNVSGNVAFIAPQFGEQMVFVINGSNRNYYQAEYFVRLVASRGGRITLNNVDFSDVSLSRHLVLNGVDTGISLEATSQRVWLTPTQLSATIGNGTNVAIAAYDGIYPAINDIVISTHADSNGYIGVIDQLGNYGGGPYIGVRTRVIPSAGGGGDPGDNLSSGWFRMEIRSDGHLYLITLDGLSNPLSIDSNGHLILTI
jgi:hypothetical protein